MSGVPVTYGPSFVPWLASKRGADPEELGSSVRRSPISGDSPPSHPDKLALARKEYTATLKSTTRHPLQRIAGVCLGLVLHRQVSSSR